MFFVLFGLGPFNLALVLLLLSVMRRRLRQVLDVSRLKTMALVAGINFVIWPLILFGPGNPGTSPAIFQGSYAMMALLFIVLGAILTVLPRRAIYLLVALNVGYATMLWIVRLDRPPPALDVLVAERGELAGPTANTQRYKGRTALVTGAGSGIGQATVLRLAREGATVVGCDVDTAGLDATEKLLVAESYKAQLLTADITVQADVDRLIAAMPGGWVDLLANVAGVMDHFVPVTELDDELWDRVLAVNLTGPMRLCRAVLPAMCSTGGGAVVNVSSIGGLTGSVAGTAYVASKHGLIGLTRSLAYLYGPDGVRTNAVCPGGVPTNIGRTASPTVDWAFQRLERSFARTTRTAEPDEIAALISWLGSAEAANVNGAVITTGGGWLS